MSKPNDFPTRNGIRALRVIRANGWATAADISELGMSGPIMLLKELERQGYVVKKWKNEEMLNRGYLWACSPIGGRIVDIAIELEIGEL